VAAGRRTAARPADRCAPVRLPGPVRPVVEVELVEVELVEVEASTQPPAALLPPR